MGKNKKIILAAVAFVVVVAVFLTVYFVTRPSGNTDEKTITVTVKREGVEDKTLTITTQEEFLAGALDQEKIVKAEDIYDGMFFTVDGYTSNSNDEEWWCVYVNGERANYGIQEIPLEDGASYELVLEVGYDFG